MGRRAPIEETADQECLKTVKNAENVLSKEVLSGVRFVRDSTDE